MSQLHDIDIVRLQRQARRPWVLVTLGFFLLLVFALVWNRDLRHLHDTDQMAAARLMAQVTSLTQDVARETTAAVESRAEQHALSLSNDALRASNASLARTIRAQQAHLDVCGVPRATFPVR